MLARSIGVNIKRHRGIPPTTHMKKVYKSTLKRNGYVVSVAGHQQEKNGLVPVTLVWNGIDGFTIAGCLRKRKRIVRRFAMDISKVKYVVCGYAASISQYIVKAEKAYDLILDVENGEQILTQEMSLEEAQDYIGL